MPSGGEWAFRFASEVCRNPAMAVSRWKAASGRKVAGCIPIGVPEEIVHAAGMLPVTVWGNEFPASPRQIVPSSACSVASGVVSSVHSGKWGNVDAWIVPSTCDTLRNVIEALFPPEDERPRFPLVFPPATDHCGAVECLLDRMEAFREWAGEVAGREVSEGSLERAVRTYNENRRIFASLEERMTQTPGCFSATEFLALAGAGMAMPREGHTELLRAAVSRKTLHARNVRAKVFVTGMMATPAVMAAMDTAGAAIMGNDLVLGHRYYSGTADEDGDTLLSLVRRHVDRGLCSTMHEYSASRVDDLFRRFRDSGAEKMLLLRMRQCEPGTGDVPVVANKAKDLGIPFLCLTIDHDKDPGESVRTPIETFLDAGE